jgi:hypothetical protein
LSGSVPQCDLPTDCPQNWAMKNDQECHTRSEADQNTVPNPTGAPHLFLIVFGHQNDCSATFYESKYQIPCRPSTSSLHAETYSVTLSKFLNNESRQAF